MLVVRRVFCVLVVHVPVWVMRPVVRSGLRGVMMSRVMNGGTGAALVIGEMIHRARCRDVVGMMPGVVVALGE
jgi:hypothetical protein